MRYSYERARRNCLSPGEALGRPVTRKQAELVSSHNAELRRKSLLWDIEVCKSSKRNTLKKKPSRVIRWRHLVWLKNC